MYQRCAVKEERQTKLSLDHPLFGLAVFDIFITCMKEERQCRCRKNERKGAEVFADGIKDKGTGMMLEEFRLIFKN